MSNVVDRLMERTPDGRRLWVVAYEAEQSFDRAYRAFAADVGFAPIEAPRPVPVDEVRWEVEQAELAVERKLAAERAAEDEQADALWKVIREEWGPS